MAPIETEIDAINAARYLVMGQVRMDKLLVNYMVRCLFSLNSVSECRSQG